MFPMAGTSRTSPFGTRRRGTLVATSLLFVLVAAACDLPTLREARKEAAELPQTSFVYASNGQLITRLHAGEDRVVVRARRIPDVVRNAVIAIEDQRFHDHSGLDLRAVLRAAYVDATSGRVVEGGSTITQQLVKTLCGCACRNPVRKVFDMALTVPAELILGKERILELYLNNAEWGDGIFGIDAAARHHYGSGARGLSRTQAAGLAALLPNPLRRTPRNTGEYRAEILRRMGYRGW